MPSRTLSPRISTTTIVMSLLMTMLSFFFRDSTNIPTVLPRAWASEEAAGPCTPRAALVANFQLAQMQAGGSALQAFISLWTPAGGSQELHPRFLSEFERKLTLDEARID